MTAPTLIGRRGIALSLLVVAVVGGAVAEGAGAKRPRARVVEAAYAPDPYHGMHGAPLDQQVSVTQLSFVPRRGERAVEVELRDDVGPSVGGRIYQDDEFVAGFCGATDGPVAIEPLVTVDVWTTTGLCGDEVVVATSGTLTITFLRGDVPARQ